MSKPILIAHRGASGYRPEHTASAYRLAMAQGADFIEPDLVFTKDGHLVVRHENNIADTTNVASVPQFADRACTKIIDGNSQTGWFTEDFTLEELKSLRCVERLKHLRTDNRAFDGADQILTLDEVIGLAKEGSAEHGRTIGIYPETKHPTYFAGLGLEFDGPLLSCLEKVGWNLAEAPVFIQSFEVGNLQRLKGQTQVPLIQLMEADGAPFDMVQSGRGMSYLELGTRQGLIQTAQYAFGIGPAKQSLANGLVPTGLIDRAHDAGLKLHPWTFRRERQFLASAFHMGSNEDPAGLRVEIDFFLNLGVDGVFCDFPDIARAQIDQM